MLSPNVTDKFHGPCSIRYHRVAPRYEDLPDSVRHQIKAASLLDAAIYKHANERLDKLIAVENEGVTRVLCNPTLSW